MAVPDGRAVQAQRRRHPSGAHPLNLADRKRLEKPGVRTFPRKNQDIDQRTLVLFIEASRLLSKYYRLRHRDGTEYRLWNTQGSRAAQLGFQVERETFQRMMADTIARLNEG